MGNHKKQFVWLNPVVESIVGSDYYKLLKHIEDQGYTVVTCSNQADRIRNAYKAYIQGTKHKPVIDARCPAIIQYIKEKYPEALDKIAPIDPILIACAHELYEKHIKKDSKTATLTIVTPCTQLVDFGEAVFCEGMEFLTWKQFKKNIDYKMIDEKLSASPIPLGFFDSLAMKVEKASGEEEIEHVIKNIISNDICREIELCELLLCQDGCHNGDGL
ncbi:hypothetical protein CACET_c29910 [Clostridium aceticum]|uniref:Uncharacterized protein n=1 Tax=Clostridium aceticum TaxID=84022 RepID=A0A0D8IAT2_9CLOT|nr:[Fe-Fe] hydrogenase large subunit C-terminal domain-containing protein [Clostridium aceticum]AKL96435.1 hypothetical protein CACET_c29910 [Clostridium aceticum]KJF27390.1 hypothetical protein TZ02_08625 [Clostridium aceticum]